MPQVNDADRRAVELTLQTPGWNIIVGIAGDRIEAASAAALANTDESKFLDLYRKAHATHAALIEFLHEVLQEAESEPQESE
jgi:hypothetical protein